MKKDKYYYNCKFSSKTIKEAYECFLSLLDETSKKEKPDAISVSKDNTTWEYDSFSEFLIEYRDADRYRVHHIEIEQKKMFYVSGEGNTLHVLIELKERGEIEKVFQIFEDNLDESIIIIEKEPLKIFIGHGHDDQWRDLKDHLQDKHGLDIISYEVGPRAGLSIKEVLESMLNESSFALLVLTGEDIGSDGVAHARENVIHELGLFQGKIGFKRAIAILEKDINEFSNILGVNQIRFSKGNIKETFGEILSIIKREFE